MGWGWDGVWDRDIVVMGSAWDGDGIKMGIGMG